MPGTPGSKRPQLWKWECYRCAGTRRAQGCSRTGHSWPQGACCIHRRTHGYSSGMRLCELLGATPGIDGDALWSVGHAAHHLRPFAGKRVHHRRTRMTDRALRSVRLSGLHERNRKAIGVRHIMHWDALGLETEATAIAREPVAAISDLHVTTNGFHICADVSAGIGKCSVALITKISRQSNRNPRFGALVVDEDNTVSGGGGGGSSL